MVEILKARSSEGVFYIGVVTVNIYDSLKGYILCYKKVVAMCFLVDAVSCNLRNCSYNVACFMIVRSSLLCPPLLYLL